MDDEEGIASPNEHRIFILDTKAGTGIDEWIKTNKEWIEKVRKKIDDAFAEWVWPKQRKDKTGSKICKFTLHEEISRSTLETEGKFSQPIVVAIGPFHRQESTRISENVKWAIVYLMKMLYGLDWAGCLYKMTNQVANARECYSDSDISKDDKNFAEMLLGDSCFILFVLTVKIRKTLPGYKLMPKASNSADKLKFFRDDTTKFLDIISNKDEIAPDLLIIDNQIPFSVIEELFKELKSDEPLHEYALEFFKEIHPKSAQHYIDDDSPPKFLHLLDLFHWSRVPKDRYAVDSIDMDQKNPPKFSQLLHLFPWCRRFQEAQPDSIDRARHTPNAMELRESAAMIEKKTSGSSLDITFRGRWLTPIVRVLDIPELNIRDYSILLFYNLIAFEMQFSSRGLCTMAFSTLMKNLLQSEEDVKLLRRLGILASSSLNDRQLVDLFKLLGKLTENHRMPRDLHDICHQVRSHLKRRRSRLCGSIILQYFPNPLVTISVFAAGGLFVLTLLQTIYAMKYHN